MTGPGYWLMLAGVSYVGTQLCGPVYLLTRDPNWVWAGVAIIGLAVLGVVAGIVALLRNRSRTQP